MTEKHFEEECINMEKLDKLILELIKLDAETAWVEFKHNNYDPDMIGADISALANGAALHEKSCAYMLWGIDDDSHAIVGTDHNLQNIKIGNQELESWLRNLLSDNADFSYEKVRMNEGDVGVLIIQKAAYQPVTFKKMDYIRVGSYTKKIKDYPALQAQLWDRLRNENFERQYARQDLSLSNALSLLDYTTYFDIMRIPQPSSEEEIANYMIEEQCIIKQDNGLFAISNMGAILLGKKLSDFDRISRKAIRVVQYDNNNRLNMVREDVGTKGYAVGFEGLIKYIEALLPSVEVIKGAMRETQTSYPAIAIREIIANALIHQDFTIRGTGPTIEVFTDRIEVTNAGIPLVDIKRIVDNPPKSRNEKLASLMRRLRMCEELGTGWDKIVISCELQQLPAPKIELYEENTKVTLYSEKDYTSYSMEEKLRACYLHSCIKQVQGEQLTNSSLRERFGLQESSSGSISRLIKEAVELGYIKALDPDTAPRYMKYVPIWA